MNGSSQHSPRPTPAYLECNGYAMQRTDRFASGLEYLIQFPGALEALLVEPICQAVDLYICPI